MVSEDRSPELHLTYIIRIREQNIAGVINCNTGSNETVIAISLILDQFSVAFVIFRSLDFFPLKSYDLNLILINERKWTSSLYAYCFIFHQFSVQAVKIVLLFFIKMHIKLCILTMLFVLIRFT